MTFRLWRCFTTKTLLMLSGYVFGRITGSILKINFPLFWSGSQKNCSCFRIGALKKTNENHGKNITESWFNNIATHSIMASIASQDAKKVGWWLDDQNYDGSAESTGIENLLIQLYKTNSLRASDAFLARCEMILSSEITGLGIE